MGGLRRRGVSQGALTCRNSVLHQHLREQAAADERRSNGLGPRRKVLVSDFRHDVSDVERDDRHDIGEEEEDGEACGAHAAGAGGGDEEEEEGDLGGVGAAG